MANNSRNRNNLFAYKGCLKLREKKRFWDTGSIRPADAELRDCLNCAAVEERVKINDAWFYPSENQGPASPDVPLCPECRNVSRDRYYPRYSDSIVTLALNLARAARLG